MDKISYDQLYSRYLRLFDEYSYDVFDCVSTNSNLADAMKYSFFAGGKRIRPVLTIAVTEFLGGSVESVLPYAFAVESIHTYSLIHDDLPALDNDVLRRGKPTNHVRFDEATAILAGDALLNLAFEVVLKNVSCKEQVSAALKIAEYSGFSGMLGGQKADMENERNQSPTKALLDEIYSMKTGALLKIPFVVPTVLFAPEKIRDAEFVGGTFGRLFQYADDLSDVLKESNQTGKSSGKDAIADKLTSVKVLGEAEVKRQLKTLSQELKKYSKLLIDTEFFNNFLDTILDGLV